VFSGLAPRRRLVLALLAAVLVVVLAGVGLLVADRLAADEAEPVPQDALGPVLLVPGYGGGQGALRSLTDILTAQGRDATIVAAPGNGTGDLAETADALGDAVGAALERTGASSVDIVGFSAGGVVARLWVGTDDNAGRVRRVVTIGSPHHGTTLADLAGDVAPEQCPIGCTQLGTASDLLARLNAGDETPEGPTWVSIWTENDQTVTPPDSARLDGALNIPVQSVCPGVEVAHGELPRNPFVQAIVLAELEAGDPARLTEADCPRAAG
jgi:triacylglycerol esterase/lipase EstA (alpha/beta hydrolase family)